MAMQLMAGAQIIDVNQGMKEDRALFGGAQKVRARGCCMPRGLSPSTQQLLRSADPRVPSRSGNELTRGQRCLSLCALGTKSVFFCRR